MDNLLKDITVIIRSVGERTEEACLQIVKSQIGADDRVFLVKNRPFAEAHLECIRLAMEQNAKWSIFLDADILLRENSIREMLSDAETFSFPFYMLNFQILDYGFDGPSYGVHLYATEQFRTAMQFEGKVREAQRPETLLTRLMGDHGIPSLRSKLVEGVHGYEQYYADLYRTTFIRAVKFSVFRDYFLKLYRTRYESNDSAVFNYRVMLWAFLDGTIFHLENKVAPLEKEFYSEKCSEVFRLLKLQERDAFSLNGYSVDRIIQEHVANEDYQVVGDILCRPGIWAVPVPNHSLRSRIRKSFLFFARRIKNVIKASVEPI